ncbi:MAG: Rho termination factor N-terminal domain-containing protein [Promethearchaeota archaeon]
MINKDLLHKLLALETLQDLKATCKAKGLKGYSKYKKADLISFIIKSLSEEELQTFIKKEAGNIVRTALNSAMKFLEKKNVGGETLSLIKTDSSGVKARFQGMKWETTCTAKVEEICAPTFDYSCTCNNASSGALCIHYWTLVLFLLGKNKINKGCLGILGKIIDSFYSKNKSRISEATFKLEKEESKKKKSSEKKSRKSENIDDLMKASTIGKRYETAAAELGLPALTAGDDGKKTGKESTKKKTSSKHVEIQFIEKQFHPSIRLNVKFFKIEKGIRRLSSLKLLIDEEKKILAHENCRDFQIRMLNIKKACKHVLQVLMSLNDDNVARKILENLKEYRFLTRLPEYAREKENLPEELLNHEKERTTPGGNIHTIKDEILTFIQENGPEEGIDERTIKEKLGKKIDKVLKELIEEKVIWKTPGGLIKFT